MREAIKNIFSQDLEALKSRDDLEVLKRRLCKEYGLKSISNSEILEEYRREKASGREFPANFLALLRKRSIRTMSGIAPVAVLTKPYPCPGSCAYCPHEKEVPVSYLSNEPAVMRAIRCSYDPYRQTISRLRSLEANGHQPEKIELIVIGGTWSYLPTKYKYWFILNCFKAANDFSVFRKNKSLATIKIPSSPYRLASKIEELRACLKKEQRKNETAAYRLVGLTLETRPDYLDDREVEEMRSLGCTRVEIGVQAPDDQILKINKRGHGVLAISEATEKLRNRGFKITYHLMPGLPGSSPKKDLELFKQLFSDERFQPDQIKFYPTVVTKGSLLYRWYKQGKYQPYTDKQLEDLIIACKLAVPDYVRIIRLIRDIPSESIIAGNKITNLRQIMQQRGVKCRCIRCREVKDSSSDKQPNLNIEKYQAAGGQEFFISFVGADNFTLYGFCRLRLAAGMPFSAIIRELHVYGELAPLGKKKLVQHQGLGRRLLKEAENIASQGNCRELAVISGVGVRDYYRKQGYRLRDGYMYKKL
jgi:elongator complex protein 3